MLYCAEAYSSVKIYPRCDVTKGPEEPRHTAVRSVETVRKGSAFKLAVTSSCCISALTRSQSPAALYFLFIHFLYFLFFFALLGFRPLSSAAAAAEPNRAAPPAAGYIIIISATVTVP